MICIASTVINAQYEFPDSNSSGYSCQNALDTRPFSSCLPFVSDSMVKRGLLLELCGEGTLGLRGLCTLGLEVLEDALGLEGGAPVE